MEKEDEAKKLINKNNGWKPSQINEKCNCRFKKLNKFHKGSTQEIQVKTHIILLKTEDKGKIMKATREK